jgi:hypothetical protein
MLQSHEGYLDESESYAFSPRIYVVAGWIAEASIWRGIERLWKAETDRLGVTEFHAADCLWGKEEYDGLSDADRDAHRWRLIGLLRSVKIFGVATTLTLDESAGPVKRRREYAYCLYESMAAMAASITGAEDEVAFLADRKGKHTRELHEMHGLLLSDHDFRSRRFSAGFGDSEQWAGIQAADLLAYEIYLQRRFDIENRPSRAEFDALDGRIFRRTLHWDQGNNRLHDYDFRDD